MFPPLSSLLGRTVDAVQLAREGEEEGEEGEVGVGVEAIPMRRAGVEARDLEAIEAVEEEAAEAAARPP